MQNINDYFDKCANNKDINKDGKKLTVNDTNQIKGVTEKNALPAKCDPHITLVVKMTSCIIK